MLDLLAQPELEVRLDQEDLRGHRAPLELKVSVETLVTKETSDRQVQEEELVLQDLQDLLESQV